MRPFNIRHSSRSANTKCKLLRFDSLIHDEPGADPGLWQVKAMGNVAEKGYRRRRSLGRSRRSFFVFPRVCPTRTSLKPSLALALNERVPLVQVKSLRPHLSIST